MTGSPWNDYVPYKNGVYEDNDDASDYGGHYVIENAAGYAVFLLGVAVIGGSLLFKILG